MTTVASAPPAFAGRQTAPCLGSGTGRAFVSPTQRGCVGLGAQGCRLPARGPGVLGSSALSPGPPGGPAAPIPLSWDTPRGVAGHQDGAAVTDAAGAGTAELGKEVLALERPAGTPTHGPAQETPGAPAEEQGSIPIPSAGLLQVTERRRECRPTCTALPVPCLPLGSPACP